MDDSHLTRDLLQGLSTGSRNPGDLFSIVISHLFDICPVCEAEFKAFKDDVARTRKPGYDPAFEKVLASLPSLRKEADKAQTQARSDLTVLLREDRASRPARLLSFPKPRRSLPLASILIEQALASLPGQPEDCLSHARLARMVLNHLEATEPSIELYAQALACIAAGRRIGGDLFAASDLFDSARFLLRAAGIGSRRTRSLLDWFQGVLLRDQRRLQEAIRLLKRAATSFAMEGAQSQASKVFLSLALAHRDAKQFPEAISTIEDAVSLQGRNPQPLLTMQAHHALALCLCEAGSPEIAEGLFRENIGSYERYCDPLGLVRVSWLEGKLALGMGSAAKAEVCLRRALDGFRSRQIASDAALVALDLATLYLAQGRKFEVKALTEESAFVFDRLQIPCEARAARNLHDEAERLG